MKRKNLRNATEENLRVIYEVDAFMPLLLVLVACCVPTIVCAMPEIPSRHGRKALWPYE